MRAIPSAIDYSAPGWIGIWQTEKAGQALFLFKFHADACFRLLWQALQNLFSMDSI
jgi:hypothetical protein